MAVKTFTVEQRGIGRPDYSATALQEPWVARTPGRRDISAGWIYSQVAFSVNLPAGAYTPLAELTAAEVESLGLETILMETWVADSPNVRCYATLGSVTACGGVYGCSAAFFYNAHLRGTDMPYCTHVYDDILSRYGVICRLKKDLGRGYAITHGLYNPDGVDHTCITFIISYERRIPIT